MFSFKKKEKLNAPLNVPKHIAVIMDGNGRWAKKRMQPRVFGHKAGMETLQKVTLDCLCFFYGKLVSAGKASFLYHESAG